MPIRRRYLIDEPVATRNYQQWVATQEERFTECPDAARYSDEEAEEFGAIFPQVEKAERRGLVHGMRRARMAFPPELAFDPYRLAWHILHRCQDPAFREAILVRAIDWDFRRLGALARRGDTGAWLEFIDSAGPLTGFAVMRRNGLAHLIPELSAAFSPEQAARHRGLLLYIKRHMHRFYTQPEPSCQASRWEQYKLKRRIRLRDVQLTSMSRSLHRLQRERKVLLVRLRETERQELPGLKALAAELDAIRKEQANAERLHAARLADQATRHRAAIAELQAQLASALQDYTRTLAERTAWLPGKRRGVT